MSKKLSYQAVPPIMILSTFSQDFTIFSFSRQFSPYRGSIPLHSRVDIFAAWCSLTFLRQVRALFCSDFPVSPGGGRTSAVAGSLSSRLREDYLPAVLTDLLGNDHLADGRRMGNEVTRPHATRRLHCNAAKSDLKSGYGSVLIGFSQAVVILRKKSFSCL